MKTPLRIIAVPLFLLCSFFSFSQTSWKGITSTNWATATNWTAGVPTSTVDAIIGDANFTGVNQPTISATAVCKTLTLGGAVTTILNIGKTTTVSGNITINSNATVTHGAASLTITGNWVNNGTYNTTSTASSVIFAGTVESIQGSAITAFRILTINAGSVTTLNTNATVTGTSSICTIKGTLNPNESPVRQLTATAITVASSAVLKVTGAQFTDNYSISGITTLSAGSTVDYSATVQDQTVSSAYTYSSLSISGAGIKSLSANLPALLASSSSVGKISVTAGIFDLTSYTASRGTTVAGGAVSVSNGAFLKIGGTGTFPANYTTNTLSLTSTVEYYGTDQTVSAKTYGNLKVSSAAGAVIKTFPIAAFTIAGNFTNAVGAGTSVSCVAGANITVTGQVNLGASTTFNASSYTITVAGNWINDGIFMGGSGIVSLTGAGSTISGSGTHGFNSLTITGSGITSSVTSLTLSGSLATSGSGTFTYSAGTLLMSGTTKTITGTNISLNNLTITGTITTSSSITVSGDANISGSFTQSAGTILMNGTAKSLSGGGTIIFKTLQLTGTVTASTSFSIGTSLLISGSFIANAGTATFTGSSTLNGTANLYNVTINGTTLILSASSVLGIANLFTITTGTLNVTTNIPNTVNFNGAVAQTVNAITYNHLILSNGNTKTAAGNITVNGNFTISGSTTFAGSSFLQIISGNWINSGAFIAGTSTVKLSGTANTSITGATTFNILTISKTSSTSIVTLMDNITVPTVNMTIGNISTGSNSITITTTRTGPGIILGTITRTHTFTTGIAYAFEGLDNYITFTSVSGVSSITVNVTPGSIPDFPNAASINRVYNISVSPGTYVATLRLHYEDAELNGNSESAMQLWQYNGTAWLFSGKTANNVTSNFVEQSSLTNINNRWSCSDNAGVIKWNGSASSNWSTPSNWTPAILPGGTEIVQIGTIAFVNQPTISTGVTVKSIYFGSVQSATLTLAAGGSLTTNGNINGAWSASASHNINTGNQNMTVNGDFTLSDGTTGHTIDLFDGTGAITINGSLIESGGANISFSGAGSLSIKNDFTYSSGTFIAGAGTVTYNGTGAQLVAPVNYNHLTINKATGIARMNASAVIGGNLLISSGEFDINANTTIAGNVTINSLSTLYGDGVTIYAGGNWTNTGTFSGGTGMVNFNGTAAQSISSGTFNDLTINKLSGTGTLAGNITLSGNLNLQAGTLNLLTYTADRNTSGGQFTMASGTVLQAGGANNFPQNYTDNLLASSSTVNYNGTSNQSVSALTYGNLIFSNGGSNTKTLTGSVDVAGDITLNSGASTDASSYTINLLGNWINSGTFIPSSGALILNGSGKTITGNTTFNKVTVNGSYTVAGSDITYNGLLYVTGSATYAAGAGTATVNGDLTNSGTLTSSGTTTFSGTALQTIHLNNALSSTSTGIVNFNGNVSPVLNSTSTPTFANLNINNTAGINPSVNWLVLVSMTVGSGGVFNGGSPTHTIAGSFTNNGTVTSTGTMNFAPASANTIKLSGTSFSSTGTVIFGGAGQMTITGTPTSLNDVRITNTNSAGVSPPSGWAIDNDFIIASNSLFNAGSYTHTVGGDIESNGTLDGGSSTFVMSAPSGLLTGSPNTTFNNFTITGSIASNSDYNVAGNFMNNGTYDGSIGTLIMTGSNPSIIGGTTIPSTIAQLTIAKTGASTLTTMAGNISNVFTLYVNSGTLFTSTNGITQDPSGGLLMISNGATLRLGGTNSLPGFSAYGFDIYSTVDYAGTNQILGNAAAYGNLMITAAGTKVGTVPLIVQNDFTLSAGTFSSGVSVTHTIGGNWTMSGGTYTNASSTILFNGSGNQYISSTGAFNNLTVNKPSGLVYLSSSVTVNAILGFTSGKVSIDNNNLTIGNSGSITGAGTNNYIIATGSGSLNQQVLAGTGKSFPVGLSAAYTPATLTLTAGSTTDIFSLRMLPAAYTQGSTGVAISTNAVNATWMIAEAVLGGSNATVGLQWPASLEMSGFNRTFSRLSHYYSGLWDYGPTDISASGSNPYSVNRSGFTGFSPFAVGMFAALPVTWLSVSGEHKNNDNYIYWSTATEMNNDYFAVEVSDDGTNFSELGKVEGSDKSTSAQNYQFIHHNAGNPLYYYRIRQVDLDGRFTYSTVIKITSGAAFMNTFTISPNPVSDQAMLNLNTEKPAVVSIIISTINGQIMYTSKERLTAGNNQIKINLAGKASGVYILQINDGEKLNQVIRFVKK